MTINPDHILMQSPNKYLIGMQRIAWQRSEMRDCKVKIEEENGIWYLLKDLS